MKRFAICTAILTAMALGGAARAGLDKQEPQLRLELDLADGSHIMGIPSIDSVPLQTSYAKMDIALKQILTIRIEEDHEKASMDLWNGDKLKGVITLEPIKLETLFGTVKIGVEHIKELRVVLGGRTLPEELKNGLVLYYTFDMEENGNVTDSSAKKNDGSVHGAKWTPKGKIGGAYDFNGNGDCIDTGRNFSGMDEISVCGWVRPARAQRGSSVVTQFGGPASDNVWGLFAQNDDGNDLVPPHQSVATVLTADGRRLIVSGKRTQIGQWTHLCLTFKRNGQLVLYKDGVEVGRDSVSDSPLNKRSSTAKVGASFGGDGYWANGLVDEVMIFSRSLTANEVKQIHDIQK